MKTSNNGRKFIESFEGLILQSYDDYNDHTVKEGDHVYGTLTIGYGHTTAAGGVPVYIGQTITKEQADQYLAEDLVKVENEINSLVHVNLNQNQFDALVSFHYNTGALCKSTLLKLLNKGDYSGAADEFLKWTHASGRVLQGLVRRRQTERKLFLKPVVDTTIVIKTPTQATTQGNKPTMLQILLSMVGPTQVGGWVRAIVASGLTALAITTGLPFLNDPTITGAIAAAASTVVVGLWSSLAKSGTINVPVTPGAVVNVTNPDTTHTIPATAIAQQAGN